MLLLTGNIAPHKQLANGTQVELHSLTWPSNAPVQFYLTLLACALPGEEVFVDIAPTSVNVRGRLPDCTVQSKAGYDTESTESKAEATLVVSLTLPDGLKHHKHYLARDSEALTLRASIEPRSRAVKVRPILLGCVPGSPFA